jgi:hypothetical protein
MTVVIDVKKSLFDRFAFEQQIGNLANIDLGYFSPPALTHGMCIYGGATRFTDNDATAETGVLIQEQAFVTIYIKVVGRDSEKDMATTDGIMQSIAQDIRSIMKANPSLGTATYLGVTRGLTDHAYTDDESISIMTMEILANVYHSY